MFEVFVGLFESMRIAVEDFGDCVKQDVRNPSKDVRVDHSYAEETAAQ